MNWKNLLTKTWEVLNTDILELLSKKKPPEPIEVKVPPKLVVKPETSLSKLAREKSALGISELFEKTKKVEKVVKEAIKKSQCDHQFVQLTQKWVKIKKRKFELQNELLCLKCDVKKFQPIGLPVANRK